MKKVKLSQVCSFSRGLTYSKGDEVSFSSNVVLRANNIDLASNSLNFEDLRYIKDSINIKREKIAEKNTIIICTASGSKSHVGKVALIDSDYGYAFGGFMGKLIPSEECHPKYLYYILTSGLFKDYLLNLNDGTNINNLKFGDIENYELPLPSLDRQIEIVEKLEFAFAEIDLFEENLDKIRGKHNTLMQSIMNFEYQLQDSRFVALEKLVDILDNLRIPVNSAERMGRTGEVPYYGATGQVGLIDKAIFNETLILLGEDGVPFFDAAKHKAYQISGPAWVNNHAHVLRAKKDLVIQRYLLHYLNIFNYSGFVNGATRLKLTQADMRRIPVPLPDKEMQESIVKIIDTAIFNTESLQALLNLKLELSAALRQSILSRYLAEEEEVA